MSFGVMTNYWSKYGGICNELIRKLWKPDVITVRSFQNTTVFFAANRQITGVFIKKKDRKLNKLKIKRKKKQ